MEKVWVRFGLFPSDLERRRNMPQVKDMVTDGDWWEGEGPDEKRDTIAAVVVIAVAEIS